MPTPPKPFGWATKKASPDQRGYGHYHRKLRAKWQGLINEGGVNCTRCGRGIPTGDRTWHLGHDDEDRTKYRGPEHGSCNVGAASKKAHERRRGANPTPRPQTQW